MTSLRRVVVVVVDDDVDDDVYCSLVVETLII